MTRERGHDVLRTLGAAVAVAALAAGCAGDPPPAGTLPPLASASGSSSGSASPSSSGSSSPVPSVAVSAPSSLSPEEQAAAAAVVDYYGAFEESYEARDANILRSKSIPGCPCGGGAESIQRALDLGGTVSGGGVTLNRVEEVSVSPDGGSARVVAVGSQASGQVTGEDGAVLGAINASDARTQVLTLVRPAGDWLIARVDRAP